MTSTAPCRSVRKTLHPTLSSRLTTSVLGKAKGLPEPAEITHKLGLT
jgi:hypothetical protein